MSTQSNGQKTSVVGVVTAAYDPEKRERLKDGATYISPGRIYLDVKGTVCEVACWSVDSDKVNMPPFWTGIDFDTIEGRNVVISATYDKEYTNPKTNETKHQYKSPTDIQYLDGDAPTPKEATPEPTGERASTPPNTAILKPLDPNGRDVMIVDQVIFKGAMELRCGGAAVSQAVADAIAVWNGVRARHFVTQETDDEAENPDLESLESF